MSQLLSITGNGEPGSGIRTFEVPDAESVALRTAVADDAGAIHELIDEHLSEGHLLPRALGEILVHVDRFVVAVHDDEVVALRGTGAAQPDRSPKCDPWS